MARLGRPPAPPGTLRIPIRGSLSPDAARALATIVDRAPDIEPEQRAEIAVLLRTIPRPKRKKDAR